VRGFLYRRGCGLGLRGGRGFDGALEHWRECNWGHIEYEGELCISV